MHNCMRGSTPPSGSGSKRAALLALVLLIGGSSAVFGLDASSPNVATNGPATGSPIQSVSKRPPALPASRGPLPPGVLRPEAAPGNLGPARPAIEVTAAQVDEASQIMSADPRVTVLLTSGGGFEIARSGPWTTTASPGTPGAQRRLLGVAMVVHLASTTDLTNQALPEMLYDDSEASEPPYQEYEAAANGQSVQDLQILVDLARQKVVSVSALPGQVFSAPLPPGVQRTVPVFPNEGAREAVLPPSQGAQP